MSDEDDGCCSLVGGVLGDEDVAGVQVAVHEVVEEHHLEEGLEPDLGKPTLLFGRVLGRLTSSSSSSTHTPTTSQPGRVACLLLSLCVCTDLEHSGDGHSLDVVLDQHELVGERVHGGREHHVPAALEVLAEPVQRRLGHTHPPRVASE